MFLPSRFPPLREIQFAEKIENSKGVVIYRIKGAAYILGGEKRAFTKQLKYVKICFHISCHLGNSQE